MSSATSRLSRVIFVAALACAISAPAAAGSTDYLLKLGGVDGDTKGESQDDKHKDWIEVLSYSFGETQSADALTDGLMVIRNSADGGGSGEAARVSKVDAFTIKQGTAARSGEIQPALAIGHEVQAPRDTASGQATGKRMHKPLRLTKPLERGSVMLAGAFAGCAVGKRYPLVEIGGKGTGYQLKNVEVVACDEGTMTANYDGLLIVRY